MLKKWKRTFFCAAANPETFHEAILMVPAILTGNSMFSGSSLFVGCAFSGATPTSSPLAASFFLVTFTFFAFDPPSSLSDAAGDELRLLFEDAARFGGMEKFFNGRSEVRGKEWCLMLLALLFLRP